MIYASGVVSFLSNNTDRKSIVNRRNRTITLEFIERIPSENNGSTSEKITCKFTVLLPRSYECKTLEDYTGKIKPFLQASIKKVIVSVAISHLNYASSGATDLRKTTSYGKYSPK
ncbi:hypothetical protein [Sporosarcina sp. G11-34]|uniref:hypothetical protein n=1 Tax=Sporosarcina sp. G11-34 TaxID=2849605 RepID=UPI0022A8EAE4|nr:hypothetical protein [Sporosarcina sp. G11-34]MCZ2258126.1 hypothetical protein [Sporosarcina sp. G11-34]